MPLEEDLTILIDYEKYQEHTQRIERQLNGQWMKTTNTSILPQHRSNDCDYDDSKGITDQKIPHKNIN